jgi:hypothetical protein
MVAKSTRDVPLAALHAMSRRLHPVIDLHVDEGQLVLLSAAPPSWVTLIADPYFWLNALGAAAAIYVAEIVREAGRSTWRAFRRPKCGPAEPTKTVDVLADGLITLMDALPSSEIALALPIPDQHHSTRLILVGRTPDEVAAQITLFVNHLPALTKIIEQNRLDWERAFGGIFLRLNDDGSLEVTWMHASSGTITKVVLHVVQ